MRTIEVPAATLATMSVADAREARAQDYETTLWLTPVEGHDLIIVNMFAPVGTAFAGVRLYGALRSQLWPWYLMRATDEFSQALSKWLRTVGVRSQSDQLGSFFSTLPRAAKCKAWPRSVSAAYASYLGWRHYSICVSAASLAAMIGYVAGMEELLPNDKRYVASHDRDDLTRGTDSDALEVQALCHFSVDRISGLVMRQSRLFEIRALLSSLLQSKEALHAYSAKLPPFVAATGGINLYAGYPEFQGETSSVGREVHHLRLQVARLLDWPQLADSIKGHLRGIGGSVGELSGEVASHAREVVDHFRAKYPFVEYELPLTV